MSQQIPEGAKCEHDLSLRLAGVNELIAAEGKYHPNCYKKFMRNVSRSSNVAKDESGTVLLWLIDELKSLQNKIIFWSLIRKFGSANAPKLLRKPLKSLI